MPNAKPLAGLLVKDGAIQRIEIDRRHDGATHVHELIGDHFSQCFLLPGSSARRRIIGYADDVYLYKSRDECPWNVILDTSVYSIRWPVAGPIVVETVIAPDSVAMSELEMSALRIVPGCLWPIKLEHAEQWGVASPRELADVPQLIFRPGYDVDPFRPDVDPR